MLHPNIDFKYNTGQYFEKQKLHIWKEANLDLLIFPHFSLFPWSHCTNGRCVPEIFYFAYEHFAFGHRDCWGKKKKKLIRKDVPWNNQSFWRRLRCLSISCGFVTISSSRMGYQTFQKRGKTFNSCTAFKKI